MDDSFDAAWKRLAVAGDERAVQRLAQRNLEPLYRFCLYRVGQDRYLCEEAVQETLVRAIRDVARYDPERSGGNVFPWLIGLARNEVRRLLAREKSNARLESIWARMDEDLRAIVGRLEHEPLSDDFLRREETREMVNATMSQLPPHYREALEQKYVARRSIREIAVERKTTEKAIESLLARARRAFRETFQALARNLSVEVTNP